MSFCFSKQSNDEHELFKRMWVKIINHLKPYFSKDSINERLPYDRKNFVIPRITSFIGSTNMSTFLQDETGSVRWLCFVVKSINRNYKTEFNIDNFFD